MYLLFQILRCMEDEISPITCEERLLLMMVSNVLDHSIHGELAIEAEIKLVPNLVSHVRCPSVVGIVEDQGCRHPALFQRIVMSTFGLQLSRDICYMRLLNRRLGVFNGHGDILVVSEGIFVVATDMMQN